MDLSNFLTMNLRNWNYLKKNSGRGRKIADSKIKTKKILQKAGVPVPKLIKRLKTHDSINKFKWEKLQGNFVVKPSSSSAGEGILIIRRKGKWAGEWYLMDGKKIDISDLRFHCHDILGGHFNVRRSPDIVFIEERIKILPKFLRYTKEGLPDIRLIMYNQVPVMAMLRVPTKESQGKANISAGAIGLGIDLATGITTYGVHNDQAVKKIYHRRKKKMVKVNGIKIPKWKEILKTAVKCQRAVPSLGFIGVDIVLDKKKGPMVLEINARPGLSIQICNRAGLRKRLERVEGLDVYDVSHGVKITRALFAEKFASKVFSKEKSNVLEMIEPIKIKPSKGKKVEILAKLDTGAYRSSIDEELADELGLLDKDNVLYERHYQSSMARGRKRKVVKVPFWLRGKKIVGEANVSSRKKLRTKFLLGRRDLKGYLVRI